MVDAQERYEGWSHTQLIARIQELENRGGGGNSSTAVGSSKSTNNAAPAKAPGPPQQSISGAAPTPPKAKKERRPFIVSDLPTRKVALRFAYDGASYSGLAAQSDGVAGTSSSSTGPAESSLPTVEAVLWNALCLSRLVDPEKGMSGAGWTRCGRTDKGVSAGGQVVSLWVRSVKVDERELRRREEERLAEREAKGKLLYHAGGVGQDESDDEVADVDADEESVARPSPRTTATDTAPWSVDNPATLLPGLSSDSPELPYVLSLNRLLPDSIRVLDWSPVRPSFNARFDCRYRHYKYFFPTGPPELLIAPPGQSVRGCAQPRMDIEAMREAASYLLGDHDFRNLCKVDASKQITNFRRRIDGVSIDKVEPGWPAVQEGKTRVPNTSIVEPTPADQEEMYVLNLRGTAFLYHQVRHIMAILFLVGARMEKPSIVKELINTRHGQWEDDVKWLYDAGVRRRRGAVALPGSTATEVDGATAVTSVPQLTKATAAATLNGHHEEEDALEDDIGLTVFDLKPMYELSADRPLVLWECGFRPCDIQWRSGAYDGDVSSAASLGPKAKRDLIMAASSVSADLYRTWQKSAISAEIARHFVLAAASPGTATKGCGALYEETRWPYLTVPPQDASAPSFSGRRTSTLPFGNGAHRPVAQWSGLINRKREDSPQIKNERWLEGRGKRVAARRGVESAAMLPKGGSSKARREREERERSNGTNTPEEVGTP